MYCGAPISICDPITLDNPKNHTALPYITWGLIYDSKIRKKESLRLKSFTRQASRISKLRRRSHWKLNLRNINWQILRESNFTWTSHEERRKVLVVKLIASKDKKSKSSNSSIWDELKFITSGMDKRNRKIM